MPTLLPQPWPSGPVGGLYACGSSIFGVAGTRAIELSETFDVVEPHRMLIHDPPAFDAAHFGEMKHGIEQQ